MKLNLNFILLSLTFLLMGHSATAGEGSSCDLSTAMKEKKALQSQLAILQNNTDGDLSAKKQFTHVNWYVNAVTFGYTSARDTELFLLGDGVLGYLSKLPALAGALKLASHPILFKWVKRGLTSALVASLQSRPTTTAEKDLSSNYLDMLKTQDELASGFATKRRHPEATQNAIWEQWGSYLQARTKIDAADELASNQVDTRFHLWSAGETQTRFSKLQVLHMSALVSLDDSMHSTISATLKEVNNCLMTAGAPQEASTRAPTKNLDNSPGKSASKNTVSHETGLAK